MGSKTSSKLLGDSQAKTWHKTDTDTDIPSRPLPPANRSNPPRRNPATRPFRRSLPRLRRREGPQDRRSKREAWYAAIAGNPVELTRLQTARPPLQVTPSTTAKCRSGHIPRLNTWLRDQWKTWAPEPSHARAPIHKHTWTCEHVHQLMDPHEDEYDHTGSLRQRQPKSKWWKACQACADELNNQQETSKEKQ